jgi:hypothetical protein
LPGLSGVCKPDSGMNSNPSGMGWRYALGKKDTWCTGVFFIADHGSCLQVRFVPGRPGPRDGRFEAVFRYMPSSP